MNTTKVNIFLRWIVSSIVKIGYWIADIFRKSLSNKNSIFGFTILVFYLLVAIFGPILFPYDANTDIVNKYAAVSWQHPMGTDWLGRDVFRQLIDGTGSVLITAFYAALFTVAIGTFLGILSGYLGGMADKIVMAITNIFLAIPSFPVYLLLAAVITINTPETLSLIIALFSWAGLCRSIRSQVISLKSRDFIQICTVMRMSKAHVIFNELMPNILSYIVINFVLVIRKAIMASVGIMLVGLAAYNPTDWGAMMNAARSKGFSNIRNVYIMLYPLIAIIILQVGALSFANGLDAALNPRLRIL